MATVDDRSFQIDARLAADSDGLGRMQLCQIRIMNDRRWPWLVLVPMRSGVSEWHDLDETSANLAANEIRIASAALKATTGCLKVNVAALGNIVRQLHIHVVARDEGDPNWPGPVWGFGKREPYPESELEPWRRRIGDELAKSGAFFGNTL